MGVERERDEVEKAGRKCQCQECNPIQVMAPNVRKNATHKESSREKSYVHRAKFNGRPKLPGWPGKRWYRKRESSGQAWPFIEEGG
jgi:hypothetical protein